VAAAASAEGQAYYVCNSAARQENKRHAGKGAQTLMYEANALSQLEA
jgi:hypothetical protein